MVLSVVFEQCREAGPESGEDVVCVDIAATDAPAVVGEELVTAAESVKVSETAGRRGIVEADTEHAEKEVGVRLEVEQVVKVLRGEEERGRSRLGVRRDRRRDRKQISGVFRGGNGGWKRP